MPAGVAVGAWLAAAGASAAVAGVAAAVVNGAIIGAIVGGVTAAVTGGDIMKGILMGGLIGGVTAGLASGLESLSSTAVPAGEGIQAGSGALSGVTPGTSIQVAPGAGTTLAGTTQSGAVTGASSGSSLATPSAKSFWDTAAGGAVVEGASTLAASAIAGEDTSAVDAVREKHKLDQITNMPLVEGFGLTGTGALKDLTRTSGKTSTATPMVQSTQTKQSTQVGGAVNLADMSYRPSVIKPQGVPNAA